MSSMKILKRKCIQLIKSPLTIPGGTPSLSPSLPPAGFFLLFSTLFFDDKSTGWLLLWLSGELGGLFSSLLTILPFDELELEGDLCLSGIVCNFWWWFCWFCWDTAELTAEFWATAVAAAYNGKKAGLLRIDLGPNVGLRILSIENGKALWTAPGKGKKGWNIKGGLWIADKEAGGELSGGVLPLLVEASESGESVTRISGLWGWLRSQDSMASDGLHPLWGGGEAGVTSTQFPFSIFVEIEFRLLLQLLLVVVVIMSWQVDFWQPTQLIFGMGRTQKILSEPMCGRAGSGPIRGLPPPNECE